MESIGEKLREAREARKLSLKDVVKETNISPIYLTALEEEKFDKFPSETYLIGFLRTYAEFLRLDPETLVHAYKGYKIGESATPLEELTRPTRSRMQIMLGTMIDQYRKPLIIGGAVLGVIVLAIVLRGLFSTGVDVSGGDSIDSIKRDYQAKDGGTDIENIRNLQLTNNSGIILVYRNEAVQFLVDNKEVVFLLKGIKDSAVELEFLPGKKVVTLELDAAKKIKVEGVPREVTVTLKGLTENRAKVMVSLGDKAVEEEKVAKNDQVVMEGVDNTSVVALDNKNLKIIFEAEFVQKSFIELYLDGTRRMRGFVPEGSAERWEASEYIQIKIGNAGGIKAKINGRAYTFGSPGQVANKIITWKKDPANPNLYHIVVKDW